MFAEEWQFAAINTAFRFHAIVKKSNMYATLCYYTWTNKGGEGGRSGRKPIALNHFWNTKGLLQFQVGNIRSSVSCRVSICLLGLACLFITHLQINPCSRKRENCAWERKEQKQVLSHQTPHTTAREWFQLLCGEGICICWYCGSGKAGM